MRTAVVTQTGTSRRSFYLGMIYGLWGVITATLSVPAFIYLFFPPKARPEEQWVDAGDISRLDPKTPVEVVFRRNRVDGWKILSEKSTAWVAKLPDNRVVAYGPQCTHLGCAYHWDEGKNDFICPCHSSIFSIDGKVVAGPAPRPLDRYQTRLDGNKLMLGPLQESPETQSMSPLREKIANWLDHRTGVETAVKSFLYEEIPASSGWHQVFGSVAIFLFLVQAFTGSLLAFNYAPTPGDAYNSLRYILTELTGGHLIRGLHHWGASMLIVVVVLHMVQVFLWGAYKKPREATWMVGVVLLLVTLAYGLTGYLLPWDNRAYWGTVVTTQIAASAPLLGPYMSRLLGGESAVGVVTFARFYGMHVLLLPPATGLLIALHVYLVRRHGVAPAPGDEIKPKRKFYPEQVFRDTVAIFFAFAILFTMAVAARVPLERLADPTDTTYIPRPEWYFLFLFQSLKLMSGPLEAIGAVGLPALAVLTLILVPFIDRSKLVKVTRRTVAMGAVGLALLGWTGLTVAAVATTPKPDVAEDIDFSGPTDWMQLSAEELAGLGYFQKEHCDSCHNVGGGKPKVGPDLATNGPKKSAAWMIDHFRRPSAMVPGSSMPPIQLNTSQLNALAVFLLKLKPANATALFETPSFAVSGALVYQANTCGACHTVNAVGMKIGPPLNGVDKRRTRDWLVKHFKDPQSTSPGTIMPPYKLPEQQLEDLTSYLLSLPE